VTDEQIRAAGGIVRRRGAGGEQEIAIVHRPRYDDWALPKGKLDKGETDEQAALREVAEETGLRANLGDLAGRISYRDRHDRAKVVSYFFMTPESGAFEPNDEVDELRWVPLEEALELLTYDRDRELVQTVIADLPPL
jgi:8-oxo-dGTP pyrophosphatase MutT (NUDIX family)